MTRPKMASRQVTIKNNILQYLVKVDYNEQMIVPPTKALNQF